MPDQRVRVMSPSCRVCERQPYFRPGPNGAMVCVECGLPHAAAPLPFRVPDGEGEPLICPAGHPVEVELTGWAPCTCHGHRITYCRCGAEIHVLPVAPKMSCSTPTRRPGP